MKILNKILHLTFSRATVVISNIILFIVASRNFSLNEYATLRQTFLPYELLVPILTLGIPTTIYYLMPRREDKKALVIHSFFLIYFMVLIFIVFLSSGGNHLIANLFNNSNLIETFDWLIIYMIIQTPITLLIPVFIYEGKTKFTGVVSSIVAILLASIGTFFIINNKGYLDVIILKSLIPIVGLSILMYFFLKLYKSKVNEMNFINSCSNIIKISIPFGLASMIGAISMQLDKVLVSSLGTTEEFAIYVNGAMEIPLIGILTGSIASILIVEMSNQIKEKNYNGALKLFRLASNKTALILFPIMIYFIFNAKEFMVILFSNKYELSAYPFIIYLTLLPIRIVVFGSILIALGKSKMILYRSIIELILNVILSIVMYKLFGYLGVAIATVVVTYFWAVPYNINIISKGLLVTKIQLFDLNILLKIMFISIVSLPIMFISFYFENLIFKMIISFILYTTCVILFYKYTNLINFDFLKRYINVR